MEPRAGSELTPSEELMLKMMCEDDLTYPEIAKQLNQVHNTVNNRADRIRKKLDVRTTAAAVYKWARLQPRQRVALPNTRTSLTHRAVIYSDYGDAKAYLTLGRYSTGQLGEVFLVIGNQGSTLRGTLDAWARMVSVALQWGVPIEDIIRKFKGVSFEPCGKTNDELVPSCSSVIDWAVRYIEIQEANRGALSS